jgi:hypothetical protein
MNGFWQDAVDLGGFRALELLCAEFSSTNAIASSLETITTTEEYHNTDLFSLSMEERGDSCRFLPRAIVKGRAVAQIALLFPLLFFPPPTSELKLECSGSIDHGRLRAI